jgi:arsenite methyltransferase
MGKEMRTEVREHYARIARGGAEGAVKSSCCGPAVSYCGGSTEASESTRLGYKPEQLSEIPVEADLGLGCGNPTALGELRKGDTVLDLGSGGGIDCFLAAKKVGATGKVIGVDMTPEMIDRARAAAKKSGYGNVEFRLGEIESLPVADRSVDAVISNCVINLSTEKQRVFHEAIRVLKPGGKAMISDIMLTEELPEKLRDSVYLFAGCVAGAVLKDDYLRMMEEAGFKDIRIVREKESGEMFDQGDESRLLQQAPGLTLDELKRIGRTIVSVQLTALA